MSLRRYVLAAAFAFAALAAAGPGKADSAEPTAAAQATADAAGAGGGLRSRFSTSLKRAQDRAQPILEQRGTWGMFLLCFAPTPMGTAAAYLGGLLRFGFVRYLAASFAAKYLLAGIVVLLALIFSDAARAVDIPEITIPVLDITIFDDGLPAGPPPSPSPTPGCPPTCSTRSRRTLTHPCSRSCSPPASAPRKSTTSRSTRRIS